MKYKAIFLALLVALLAGCSGGEREAEVSQTPTPIPTEMAEAVLDPAAWLSQADVSAFPVSTVEPVSFKDGSKLSLLVEVIYPQVTLYALSLPGTETPSLVLRQGDSLFALGDIPAEPLSSLSAGQNSLSLLWYADDSQRGGPAYDLDVLTPEGEGWARCTVSRDACAQLVRDEVETRWDDRSKTFSLSYAGQTASVALTAGEPGELVLGRMCLFPQIVGGGYELVMSAGCENGQTDLAVFRAEIVVSGDSFSLQNLRMETDPGV